MTNPSLTPFPCRAPEDSPSSSSKSSKTSRKRSNRGKTPPLPDPKASDPPDSAGQESGQESVAAQACEAETQESPDSQAPDSAPPDPEAEIARLKDQLLRAMAEMENLRRRSARELEERTRYAPGALARDLLPVADNLERALSGLAAEERAADDRLAQFASGIEAIQRDFLAAFEKNDILRLDPLEQPFNPAEHEAMMTIQDAKHPPGTVVQVMQSGYRLRDRLLRPAMVGVAEGGPVPGKLNEKV